MLEAFLAINQERIVDTLCQHLRRHRRPENPVASRLLHASVARAMSAVVATLRRNDTTYLDECLTGMASPRTVEEFPLAELHHAFTVFGELLPALLRECYGDDTGDLIDALPYLYRLINTVLNKIIRLETQATALLRQQHATLQAYSQGLETRLAQLGEELHTLQAFNERILQSMSTGLLVADCQTHRILKVNRAMEELSGHSAASMVGKTVEEIFATLQELPLARFADEIEYQGGLALEKYRLARGQSNERYRAIKGQVLPRFCGAQDGVLVFVDDISESEILRDTMSRYVSPAVMTQILASADLRTLRSERRQVTVLFADVRGFTAFAEQYPPEAVVTVLNDYLDTMVQVLFAHQGTLDKFLGDGLLAIFGAPLPQADHTCQALQAALAMQQALTAFNAKRHRQQLPVLGVGISINSGDAIVGNIGSDIRMEYTVIGDMVNVAQRLQSQAEAGDIIISAHVLTSVCDLVSVTDAFELQVKGRQQIVHAYRVRIPPGPYSPPQQGNFIPGG